jgi:hypothetical protein
MDLWQPALENIEQDRRRDALCSNDMFNKRRQRRDYDPVQDGVGGEETKWIDAEEQLQNIQHPISMTFMVSQLNMLCVRCQKERTDDKVSIGEGDDVVCTGQ